MNKIQSIVLIIILSGCGSDSSLEMCANDKWGLPSGVNMHSNCDKYLSSQQKSMSWDRRLFNEVNNSRKFFSKKYYACAWEERKKDNQNFLNQSLGKKLKNQGYMSYYSSCEVLKQRLPESFDARY